jgi:hypothetical protein
MATIVTRAGKGSALTYTEADANFTNLNNAKIETSAIGISVQSYSANLTEFATVNPTAAGLALLDDADASSQRTTLGLGTAATTSSTDYATAAQGALADTAVQPADIANVLETSDIGVSVQAYDSDLTAWAGIATTDKQDTLISGTNIKTINSTSLLGSGDIVISGAVSDGDKGDITVSGTGTVWTIDNGVVTTTKLGGDITTAGKALLDDADAAAQRATLGLGTAATTNSTAYATAAQGALADTALQPSYVENAYLITYTDLGVLPTTITLDINKKWNIGEFTGSTTTHTINAISPTVSTLEPAHFTFVNNGSVTKTVVFNSSILSIAGSTLSQITLPIGYKIDFDIRRNPLNVGASYEAKVGDVNYNQTASGLATTWNPSDIGAQLSLSTGNFTISRSGTNGVSACRAFGGKSAGKWRIALICSEAYVNANSSNVERSFGIATAADSLAGRIGSSAFAYSLSRFYSRNSTGLSTVTKLVKLNANVETAIGSQTVPALNDVDGVLVDLDAKKVWFTFNGSVLGGGDPNTGAGAAFTFALTTVFFPAISLSESGAMDVGKWTLLNEVQDPYASIWPSFATWTA